MPQPPSSEANSGSSSETYWYIWSDEKQIGPFFFSRLKQLARQGTLKLDARVRRGTTGEWVRAETLKDILFAEESKPNSVEASSVAVPKPPAEVEQQPGLLTRLTRSIRERFDDLIFDFQQGISDRSSNFRLVFSSVGLVIVAIWLTILAVRQIDFGISFTDPIKVLSSTWEELKSKRSLKASQSEWDEFAERAQRQIKPLVVQLEKTASTSNPTDQQLLWASRDFLPKMLSDARTAESDSERKFSLHLQRAKWLHDGKDIRGKSRDPSQKLKPFGTTSDIASVVFGVLFVAFDIGLVVWFLKSRKRVVAKL